MIRVATPEDNASLIRLAAACPMQAAMTICVHRAPDFFALSRIQGDPWWVVVVEDPGAGIIGCVGLAERRLWINGAPTRVLYVGDLKVDPRFRRRGVADRLLTEVRTRCAVLGEDVPILVAALAGNGGVERRIPGSRGLPELTPVGTVRVHTLFALAAGRRRGGPALTVRAATPGDLDAMAGLWGAVAPRRQGTAAWGADGLEGWIAQAPGLAVSDYLLAFRGHRLIGFLGLWDQTRLKETRVLRYGAAAAAMRVAHNLAAPVLGMTALPPAGGALRALHAVHVCAPADGADALRALLLEARRCCVRRRVPLLEIGLDPRDPLAWAPRGLFGVATDVCCYLTSARGRYAGPALTGRPVHFETALV